MKSVVINGPTGAIGMALIYKCIEEETNVLAICRKGSSRIAQIPNSRYVSVVECSLSDLAGYTNNSQFDIFYNFAWDGTFGDARNDLYLQNRNVQYSLDAVNLARKLGCHTFIGAGSQAEYGRFEGILAPSTPTLPENGYGIGKLCAGQMTRELCRRIGMRHIWARVLSVYGPYDGIDTMVMTTIRKLMNNNVPQFTKGEQMWDYLYSGDAANAFYLLGQQGIDGKVYVLGSGLARPLRDYIFDICNTFNPKSDIEFGTIPYTEKQVMYLCADISELVKDTGIDHFTPFKEGIIHTINYLRKQQLEY